MAPSTLLAFLDHAFPGFQSYARSKRNLFDTDSLPGLFAACSHFVVEQPVNSWQSLADFLNRIVGGEDAALDNAACTCFLENLAAPEHPLKPLLRGAALGYWTTWEGRS